MLPSGKSFEPDFIVHGMGVDLRNQPAHRHAYIEHLVRSWSGQKKNRFVWTPTLVARACKRAKEQRP